MVNFIEEVITYVSFHGSLLKKTMTEQGVKADHMQNAFPRFYAFNARIAI